MDLPFRERSSSTGDRHCISLVLNEKVRLHSLFTTFVSLPPKMTTNASNIVFDDIFTISAIDKEGKKFDRGN